MPSPEKIVVVIPAFEEDQTIGPLVKSLKQNPKIDSVIVVDDGSQDNTGKLAKEAGAQVVRLRKNYGKAFAFFAGLMTATKHKPTILITLDADLRPVKESQVDALTQPIIQKKANMVIGNSFLSAWGTRTRGAPISLSGQRAFRMETLQPLIRGKTNWREYLKIPPTREEPAGYILERAIHRLIRKIEIVPTNFELARSRRAPDFSNQVGVLFAKESDRKTKANKLWQARKTDPTKVSEHLRIMRQQKYRKRK